MGLKKVILKLNSTIWNRLYMPLCRMYSKHILRGRPADSIMQLLCSFYFWKVHKYWPKFKNPRSFSEKVWNRMLFNRNYQWTIFCDKLCVREYVKKKVGIYYLIPLFWYGSEPEDIPFNNLPNKFVIKTNHGCKYNIIVKDKTKLNQSVVIIQLKKWLRENYCDDKFLGIEWGYKNIIPKIIIEKFIEDKGGIPLDYKFFCFSGKVEYLLITFDRYGDPYEKHFDKKFQPLDLWNGCKQFPGKVEKPKNYDEMIQIAEILSQGLDFIRVDLYNIDGRIYFGELTCYPSGGSDRFIPREYDFLFGKKWR